MISYDWQNKVLTEITENLRELRADEGIVHVQKITFKKDLNYIAYMTDLDLNLMSKPIYSSPCTLLNVHMYVCI